MDDISISGHVAAVRWLDRAEGECLEFDYLTADGKHEGTIRLSPSQSEGFRSAKPGDPFEFEWRCAD
jgi:hypothetical protein